MLLLGLGLWWLLGGATEAPTPGKAGTSPVGAGTLRREPELESAPRPSAAPATDLAAARGGEDAADVPVPSARFRLDVSRLASPSPHASGLYLVRKGEDGNVDRYPARFQGEEAAPWLISVPLEKVRGHWVCTAVPGAWSTAYDGDAYRAGTIRLPLEPAPLVEVEVQADTEKARAACVLLPTVHEEAGRRYSYLPGPEAQARLPWRQYRLDREGWLRERFATRAAVRMRAFSEGWYADPLELDVGHEGGRFRIVLRPSAVLTVAPQGMIGGGYFQLSLRRDEPPHAVEYDLAGAHGEQAEDSYVQIVRDDLAPGAYTATIEAEHYRTQTLAFRVQQDGERVRLEPRMEPKTPLGGLHIDGLLPADVIVEDPKHVGLFDLYLRPQGTTTWDAPLEREEDWRARTLRVPVLPAGTYDALLWSTQGRAVAFVEGILIAAGKTRHMQIALARGHYFSMEPLAKAGLNPREWQENAIDFSAPQVGPLPHYISGFSGVTMVDRLGGFQKARLGPFPFARVKASYGPPGKRVRVELPQAR